ncbi:hypothetical protein ACVWWN_000200 [Mycobacterium sp. URHB0021]
MPNYLGGNQDWRWSPRDAQKLFSDPCHMWAVEDGCDAFQVVQLDFGIAADLAKCFALGQA